MSDQFSKLIERAKELRLELDHTKYHVFNAEGIWHKDDVLQRSLGELREFVSRFDHLDAETPVSIYYERDEKGIAIEERTPRDVESLKTAIETVERTNAAHERYERLELARLKKKYEGSTDQDD